MVGGLYVKGRLCRITSVASGLTKAQKMQMAMVPDMFIGKVFEASGKGYSARSGCLRHPVFERMRADKDAKECVL